MKYRKGVRPLMEKMDKFEAQEKYLRATETIRELKKQNNALQDTIKRLKTRIRWPERVQSAVLKREILENHRKLELKLVEMSEQCKDYERQIEILKALQKTQKSSSSKKEEKSQAPISNGNFVTPENSPSSFKTAVAKAMQDWKNQERSYKEQLEEAAARVQQAEDRLVQLLRLRNMDSAEMIRLARTAKAKSAEVLAIQDEMHRLKMALEQAKSRIDEMAEQFSREQQRKLELQDEVSQVQMAKQSLHDMTQELEEVKKEREMLRTHLKNALLQPAPVETISIQPPLPVTAGFEEEIATLQVQLEELQRSLNMKASENRDLTKQLQEAKEEYRKINLENHELRKSVQNSKLVAKHQDSDDKKCRRSQAVQTINFLEDFKPPEVKCALSGEESDQLLAQMHSEIESHRELVRTQKHLTKLFKEELAGVHEQLKIEREQYAAELASMVTRVKQLETLLNEKEQGTSIPDETQTTSSPREHVTPTPAPRKPPRLQRQDTFNIEPKQDQVDNQAPEEKFKVLQLNLFGITATEGSPLLKESDTDKFFVEFSLDPSEEEEPLETPGSFFCPTDPGSVVTINHKHTWLSDNIKDLCQNSSLHFNIVVEPKEEVADEGSLDCEDLGTANFVLKEMCDIDDPSHGIHQELQILNSEGLTIGHLSISTQWLQASPL